MNERIVRGFGSSEGTDMIIRPIRNVKVKSFLYIFSLNLRIIDRNTGTQNAFVMWMSSLEDESCVG